MDLTEKQLEDMLKELQSRNKATVILELAALILILLLIFLGNTLTLLVIVLNRQMRTIPNMLVASLAISDLCMGAISACPLGIPSLAASQWPFSDIVCQYEGYVAITLAIVSVHTLALMAVNRYFRIVKPAKYRRYFTKKKATIMILVTWLYAMCSSLPYLLSGHKMVFHPSKNFCYLHIDSGTFTTFLVTVYVGLPSCVIFYCYLRIFKTVHSHNNNFQGTGDGLRVVNVEEIKITRTLFVTVVFYNLCWMPILLIDILDTIRGNWTFSRQAYLAYTFLVATSSALNPIIYGVLNKKFQKEYLKVLRCSYCRPQTVVEPFIVETAVNTLARQ